MKHHHVRRKGWFCWIKNDTKDGNKIWSGSRVGVLPFIFILVSSSTLRFCCWYMFKKKPCVGNCCHHHSQPASKGFALSLQFSQFIVRVRVGFLNSYFICMYDFLKLLTTLFQTQTSTNCQSLDWYFCSKKKKFRLFLDNFTQEFQDDRKNQYDRRTNFGLTFHLINL